MSSFCAHRSYSGMVIRSRAFGFQGRGVVFPAHTHRLERLVQGFFFFLMPLLLSSRLQQEGHTIFAWLRTRIPHSLKKNGAQMESSFWEGMQ